MRQEIWEGSEVGRWEGSEVGRWERWENEAERSEVPGFTQRWRTQDLSEISSSSF